MLNEHAKILLVDDDLMNTDILSEILSDDYEVEIANSGQECLDILEEYNPDLILLDIMMPEMDGYETAKRIKKIERLKSVPIIFQTALESTKNKIMGFNVGAADYITKPFDYDEILARVGTNIALKKAMEKINNYNNKLEVMLEQRTKELIKQEKEAAFSMVIKGIIHNLKSPLTAINGGVDLAKLSFENNNMEKIPEYLSLIEKGTDRLLEMIDSMMVKSKRDQGEDPVKIDLNKLIKEELEFLEGNLDLKKANKEFIPTDEELNISVIPSDIAQILGNLIKNSLDALKKDKESKIEIRTGKDNGYVWFSVSDNGSGISKKVLPNIFDPFFTTKKEYGTGLGLYSCKLIVKNYRGKIGLKSDKNGTTVTILLKEVK